MSKLNVINFNTKAEKNFKDRALSKYEILILVLDVMSILTFKKEETPDILDSRYLNKVKVEEVENVLPYILGQLTDLYNKQEKIHKTKIIENSVNRDNKDTFTLKREHIYKLFSSGLLPLNKETEHFFKKLETLQEKKRPKEKKASNRSLISNTNISINEYEFLTGETVLNDRKLINQFIQYSKNIQVLSDRLLELKSHQIEISEEELFKLLEKRIKSNENLLAQRPKFDIKKYYSEYPNDKLNDGLLSYLYSSMIISDETLAKVARFDYNRLRERFYYAQSNEEVRDMIKENFPYEKLKELLDKGIINIEFLAVMKQEKIIDDTIMDDILGQNSQSKIKQTTQTLLEQKEKSIIYVEDLKELLEKGWIGEEFFILLNQNDIITDKDLEDLFGYNSQSSEYDFRVNSNVERMSLAEIYMQINALRNIIKTDINKRISTDFLGMAAESIINDYPDIYIEMLKKAWNSKKLPRTILISDTDFNINSFENGVVLQCIEKEIEIEGQSVMARANIEIDFNEFLEEEITLSDIYYIYLVVNNPQIKEFMTNIINQEDKSREEKICGVSSKNCEELFSSTQITMSEYESISKENFDREKIIRFLSSSSNVDIIKNRLLEIKKIKAFSENDVFEALKNKVAGISSKEVSKPYFDIDRLSALYVNGNVADEFLCYLYDSMFLSEPDLTKIVGENNVDKVKSVLKKDNGHEIVNSIIESAKMLDLKSEYENKNINIELLVILFVDGMISSKKLQEALEEKFPQDATDDIKENLLKDIIQDIKEKLLLKNGDLFKEDVKELLQVGAIGSEFFKLMIDDGIVDLETLDYFKKSDVISKSFYESYIQQIERQEKQKDLLKDIKNRIKTLKEQSFVKNNLKSGKEFVVNTKILSILDFANNLLKESNNISLAEQLVSIIETMKYDISLTTQLYIIAKTLIKEKQYEKAFSILDLAGTVRAEQYKEFIIGKLVEDDKII